MDMLQTGDAFFIWVMRLDALACESEVVPAVVTRIMWEIEAIGKKTKTKQLAAKTVPTDMYSLLTVALFIGGIRLSVGIPLVGKRKLMIHQGVQAAHSDGSGGVFGTSCGNVFARSCLCFHVPYFWHAVFLVRPSPQFFGQVCLSWYGKVLC